MLRATVSGILAHKVRLLSTAMSIVLGIAFVVGTLVLGDTLRATFDDLFGQLSENVDLQVRGVAGFTSPFGEQNDREPLTDPVLDQIAAVDGVAAVEPEYTGLAQILAADGTLIGGQGPPALGFDAPTVEELAGIQLREGRYPERRGEVTIDAATVAAQGFALGDTVLVAVDGPAEEQTLVGTFGQGDTDSAGGANVTLFDDETARELYGAEGASSAAILSAEGADIDALREEVAAAVGGDYEVLTGEQSAEGQAQEVGQFLGFMETGLLGFAFVSLLVGSFLIFNTFSITVAQRTRELALLRAVGASRRQVLTSVLAEALVVGVVGSAAGLGLGLVVASGLIALLDAFGVSLPAGDLVVASRTVLTAMVLGPVVTLVATLAPALRATHVPPVEAMRAVAAPPQATRGPLRLVLGGLVLACGVAAMVAGLFADAGLAAVGAGAVLVLLGAAALSSLVTRPLAGLIGYPVAATRGVQGRLARENTMRNPRRTAATASALMVGLGLVSFTLIFAASTEASVNRVLDEQFRSEFQVNPANFVSYPSAATEALAQIEGVAVVSTTKLVTVGVEGVARTAIGVDPATIQEAFALDTSQGQITDLGDDEVALGEDLATDLGLGVGDTIPIALVDPEEVEERRVVAVYDPTAIGASVAFTNEALTTARGDLPDSSTFVSLEEGAIVEEVRPRLEAALADYPTARLLDIDDLRQMVTEQTGQLLGLVFALLFLSVLIALFGITNTLGLSVLERTRELGLLRAIGMTRRQARTMVRWEAVVISVLGAVLGLVLGVFFGAVFIRALSAVGLEVFALPTGQLIIAVILAGLAGVLAAVLPARRASRVDILRALQTE